MMGSLPPVTACRGPHCSQKTLPDAGALPRHPSPQILSWFNLHAWQIAGSLAFLFCNRRQRTFVLHQVQRKMAISWVWHIWLPGRQSWWDSHLKFSFPSIHFCFLNSRKKAGRPRVHALWWFCVTLRFHVFLIFNGSHYVLIVTQRIHPSVQRFILWAFKSHLVCGLSTFLKDLFLPTSISVGWIVGSDQASLLHTGLHRNHSWGQAWWGSLGVTGGRAAVLTGVCEGWVCGEQG